MASASDKPLAEFLVDLASAAPVPGGGSVAALAGALAASLLAMVCRLTIGKKGYEQHSDEMTSILARCEPRQQELQELIQADIDAYARVIAAYGLPKATDLEKTVRSTEVQAALQQASTVPLRVAELCSDLLDLALPIAEKGNKNAASDAGAGALMAEAALRAAALNVSINLGGIKDQAFVAQHRARVDELTTRAEAQKQEVLRTIQRRM